MNNKKLNDPELKPLDMSDEMKSKVLKMREDGKTFDEIAQEIGRSQGGAFKIYKAAGGECTPKKKKATPQSPNRIAYSFEEFAAMAGKERTWTYRQVSKGRIRAITGFGTAMIPASEVERIFGADSLPNSEVSRPTGCQ